MKKSGVRKSWVLPLGLCLIGAGMIAVGSARGEVSEVWMKAVNICLECIGIG